MTAAPDLSRDKATLARLADIAARMDGDEWGLAADSSGMQIITRRSTGEDLTICTIHRGALADEQELIAGALDFLFLLFRVRGRAAATVRDLQRQLGQQGHTERQKDYAAQASMLLSDRAFQRFLEAKGAGGPVRDKAAADTRLKSLLAISSKKQFRTDERARAAWLSLYGDFEAWKRGGPA